MKSFAMTLNLKTRPSVVEEYKRYHRAVWPEVHDGLRNIGISRMKIYLHDHQLFMHLDADDDFDPAVDFGKLLDDPRAKEWDDLMRGFQTPVPGAPIGAWWVTLEEVFDLDW